MILGVCIGIIVGLLLAIIVFLATKRYQVPIERTVKQLENKITEKGAVFMDTPESIEIENFIEELPVEEL